MPCNRARLQSCRKRNTEGGGGFNPLAKRTKSGPALNVGEVFWNFAFEKSGAVHSLHKRTAKLHQFCALYQGPTKTRLQIGIWVRKLAPVCTELEADSIPKASVVRGCFEFPTGNWRRLGIGCRECHRNTRYCGLLLTCTRGSGTISFIAQMEKRRSPNESGV
jgi:hypothetical protein